MDTKHHHHIIGRRAFARITATTFVSAAICSLIVLRFWLESVMP